MKYEINRIDLQGVNSYLIKTEKGNILVDSGGPMFLDKAYNSRREQIVNKLTELSCTKENLLLIVLTHGDCDHSYNARYLSDLYEVPIALHKEDVYLVNQLTSEAILLNCKYKSIKYRIIMRFIKPIMKKVSNKIASAFEGFLPRVSIEDGMRLDEYGLEGTIVHIPGHTNGSIAIITDQGDCIVGDTYANLKKPGPAMNALDFNQLTDSLRKLSTYTVKKMYPGHGAPYRIE